MKRNFSFLFLFLGFLFSVILPVFTPIENWKFDYFKITYSLVKISFTGNPITQVATPLLGYFFIYLFLIKNFNILRRQPIYLIIIYLLLLFATVIECLAFYKAFDQGATALNFKIGTLLTLFSYIAYSRSIKKNQSYNN